MVATIILFIPTVILTIWLIFVSIKRRDWSTPTCFTVVTITLLYLFVHLIRKWYILHGLLLKGQAIYSGVVQLSWFDHWISTIFAPMAYIFLCTRCKRKWLTSSTFVLLFLMLMNLSTGTAFYIGSDWPTPPDADGFLRIYASGTSILTVEISTLCMILQIIWIIARFVMYFRSMQKQKLHFSQGSKALAYSVGSIIIVGLITLLFPINFWYKYQFPMWLAIILMLIALDTTLYMLSKGYALTPILDINEEPAIIATEENKESIWEELQRVMMQDKLFCSSDLHLGRVAKIMGTNRTYITNAISEHVGTNFSGYVNQLRVEYATELMVCEREMKLEDIAIKCGFGSSSSFTKIYKKQTGLTPSEGKRKKLKELQTRRRRK